LQKEGQIFAQKAGPWKILHLAPFEHGSPANRHDRKKPAHQKYKACESVALSLFHTMRCVLPFGFTAVRTIAKISQRSESSYAAAS
jgi:hypothetical protein